MSDLTLSKLFLDAVPLAMRSIRTEMRGIASTGLTTPQFRVIARLSKGTATNGELAEWMGVSAPTMSRMVDTLVRRELVVRKAESADRREVKLILSQKGAVVFRRSRGKVQKVFARRISG